jgi:hypothetical protein
MNHGNIKRQYADQLTISFKGAPKIAAACLLGEPVLAPGEGQLLLSHLKNKRKVSMTKES